MKENCSPVTVTLPTTSSKTRLVTDAVKEAAG
jgi:hypothetical protein